MDEELRKMVEAMTEKINNQPVPDFEGFSPQEMYNLIDHPYEENCPVQLLEPADTVYDSIPIFCLVSSFMDLIREEGEMKLTAKGFLLPKIVEKLYSKGFIKDFLFDEQQIKRYREIEIESILLAHILVKIGKIVKNRHGKISLTKSGEKLLDSKFGLLKHLLIIFGTQFNWSYFDAYGQHKVGRLGFCYSIFLVDKYGDKLRDNNLYVKKYFNAFPTLKHEFFDIFLIKKEEYLYYCYKERTFDRFMRYFNIIEDDRETPWVYEYNIKKSPIFDKIFKIQPPKGDGEKVDKRRKA